jgi:hypothetical protein
VHTFDLSLSFVVLALALCLSRTQHLAVVLSVLSFTPTFCLLCGARTEERWAGRSSGMRRRARPTTTTHTPARRLGPRRPSCYRTPPPPALLLPNAVQCRTRTQHVCARAHACVRSLAPQGGDALERVVGAVRCQPRPSLFLQPHHPTDRLGGTARFHPRSSLHSTAAAALQLWLDLIFCFLCAQASRLW